MFNALYSLPYPRTVFTDNQRHPHVCQVHGLENCGRLRWIGIETQIRAIKRGAQIIIGTPGRTVDLINRRVLKLQNINYVVLDEADEMLTMGFKDDLETILSETPEEKQTLLFSATMPNGIKGNYQALHERPCRNCSWKQKRRCQER